jgi:hypothetical protein
MLIIDEMENKDAYDRMKYVEFLDFLVRCSYLKFSDPKMHITEKAEKTIEILLKSRGLRR